MPMDFAFGALIFNEHQGLVSGLKEAGRYQGVYALECDALSESSIIIFQCQPDRFDPVSAGAKVELMPDPKQRVTIEPQKWEQPSGAAMSCEESILVLRENLVEIQDVCQEALEDAVLMDVSEAQFRKVLHALVDELANPYKKG